MLLFKKVSDLQTYLHAQRQACRTIGFVPTMGALHSGHTSLITTAKQNTDVVVCSIFVNPTQFNEPKDLEKYPRTEAQDIALLMQVHCDVLFLPPVAEIYPPELDTTLDLDFGTLEQVLEGEFRPGHFDGMAQVVNRLLNIVEPDKLFMGQKDFQQFSIVKNMLRQLHSPVELVMGTTIRETDGLAKSSRNVRLTPENRTAAALIYQILTEVRSKMHLQTPAQLKAKAWERLVAAPNFRPEYFDIIDGDTLVSLQSFKDSRFIVAVVATWVGDVRLIDNMILAQPDTTYSE